MANRTHTIFPLKNIVSSFRCYETTGQSRRRPFSPDPPHSVERGGERGLDKYGTVVIKKRMERSERLERYGRQATGVGWTA